MKRLLLFFLPIICLVITSPVLVLARDASPAPEVQDAQEASTIPERDGTYDEPTAKGFVKVRVIVHKEKPVRSTSAPLLVCNLDDPDSSAVVPAAGWHLPSTWTYNLNPSSVPSSVGLANLSSISANAFGTWQTAVGGKVAFTRGANTSATKQAYDGKNIVAFGNTASGTLAVTYIRYSTSGGLAVDVDTIFNRRVPWSWSNSSTCANTNSYDAQNILTHETGHWMGLDDTYEGAFIDNTMYGYGSRGEVKKNTLTTGDRAGVSAIYP